MIYGQLIQDSYIVNEKDIYYNKKAFDRGDINLCFILGLSGSGKTTMALKVVKNNEDKIDFYGLDDLWAIADRFTMQELKTYGDLIYQFFDGPGKKYYVTKDYLIKNKVPESEYEDKLYKDFVKFSESYADQHKNKKIILEGVWLYYSKWFKPDDFKNYTVYIKGTSVLISNIRAAKRDSGDTNNKMNKAKAFTRNIINIKKWKLYLLDESMVNKFRDYFEKRVDKKTKIS